MHALHLESVGLVVGKCHRRKSLVVNRWPREHLGRFVHGLRDMDSHLCAIKGLAVALAANPCARGSLCFNVDAPQRVEVAHGDDVITGLSGSETLLDLVAGGAEETAHDLDHVVFGERVDVSHG